MPGPYTDTPRHRVLEVQNQTVTSVYDTSSQYCTDQVYLTRETWSYTYEKRRVEVDDIVCQSFKERMAAGEILNNPFTKTVTVTELIPASISQTFVATCGQCNPSFRQYTGTLYPNPVACAGHLMPIKPEWLTAIDDSIRLATMRAYGKDLARAEALVSIGELPETIGMIKQAFVKATKIYFAVKRKLWRQLLRELSRADAAELWLTYRYGIRPLVSEVQTYVNLVHNWTKKQSKRFTARSSLPVDLSETSSITLNGFPSGVTSCTAVRKNTISGIARGGVLYDVFKEGWEEKLGLSNIPQTLWELTTLSFVADWFVTVGDFISAITPKAGLREKTAWNSVKYHSVQEVAYTNVTDMGMWCNDVSSDFTTITYRKKQVVKRRNPTTLIQNMYIGMNPAIRLQLEQIVDLTALMKQFTKPFWPTRLSPKIRR